MSERAGVADMEAIKASLENKIAGHMPQKDDPETRGKILGMSFALGAVKAALYPARAPTTSPEPDAVTIVAPPIPSLLQREWMAQALFEVDAPDHREWEDVWLDERERYLRLADTAIAKNLALTGDR